MQARDLVTLPSTPQARCLFLRRFRGAAGCARVPQEGEIQLVGCRLEHTGRPKKIEPARLGVAAGQAGVKLQLSLPVRGRA